MAKKIRDLRRGMSAERQARNAERARGMLAGLELASLREAAGLTQEDLARRLEISQSNVSRMERRNDVLLSTLETVVEALGGTLHVSAVFSDGAVQLAGVTGNE